MALIVASGGAWTASRSVAAHDQVTTGAGTAHPKIVTTMAFAVGLVVGLSTLYGELGGQWLSESTVRGVFGVLATLLGVSLVVSAFPPNGLAVAAGGTSGAVVLISKRGHHTSEPAATDADAIATGVLLHRVVEGLLIASLLAVNSRLTVVAALLVIAHVMVEMAVVGHLYRRVDAVTRGVVAICTAQAAFVGTALMALAVTATVPTAFEEILLMVTGSIFVVSGLHIARECLSSATYMLSGAP